MAGHIFPPRPTDQRIRDLISVHGGSVDGDIGRDVREAMALAVGKTAAYALTIQVDDMWFEFKVFMGITDDDTGDADLLAHFITEDGDFFLVKQDGTPLAQE